MKAWIGLLFFCSFSTWAQNSVSPLFVRGAYHRGGFHIPTMVKFLTDNHIQTFNLLIGDRLNDGKDFANFIQFLEATKNSDIKVWITLRPPSESAGSVASYTGRLGPDESALVNAIKNNSEDFVTWFKLCSLVASKYPHFIGVNIDDFINNVDDDFWYSTQFYTDQMLDKMKAGLRFYNTPHLAFIATTYTDRTAGETYTLTKKDAKWVSLIDVLLVYNGQYRDDPAANFKDKIPEIRKTIAAVAGRSVAEKLPIVAGIYTSGASWYGGATPPQNYVRKMLDYASALDGVMIFKTQSPTSENERIVYDQFGEWARSSTD